MLKSKVFEILPGDGRRLGAQVTEEGVNFAIFSACAEGVELCLFDEDGKTEIARLPLPENTDEIWHGFVPDLKPGALYGYRVHGPYDPANGHRFNANKLLIDPYARELVGELKQSNAHFGYDVLSPEKDLSFDEQDNASFMPKCRVVGPKPQARGPSHMDIPWASTIIYETHVKGFTQLNPAIPENLRGTYEGMGHDRTVEYIKSLGITSVELMPVHAFFDDFHLLDKGLRNYWGYNTLGFFAPAARYYGPAGLDGFRKMVRSFHDAGIEVILDVVYNHTAEGNELGPTLSFKGIDNFSYYRTIGDEHRYYVNDTGTGNTLNTSHPRVLQLVMDSLRYWHDEMEVDGFRFDLGTILGREPGGFDPRGGFFDAIAQDPALAKAKLIGEPWDIGPGGYQVGSFPPGWAEWNDKYRDSVREYWKGDPNTAQDFASRILGSGDLYDQRGRRPWSSVNFVTAHDGFTLRDLVSYDGKHNDANGEDNNDGHNDNRSHNYGWEGPADNEDINRIRARQQRNFLATLLFSHGTPMMLAGDELGHSQNGNNNAYCQDNETTWLDWSTVDKEAEALRDFTRRLIVLRKKQPLLHRVTWRDGMLVNWFAADGGEQSPEHWTEETTLCLHLSRDDLAGEPGIWTELLLIFNPTPDDVMFTVPDYGDKPWKLRLTTIDIAITEERMEPNEQFLMAGRGLALLSR